MDRYIYYGTRVIGSTKQSGSNIPFKRKGISPRFDSWRHWVLIVSPHHPQEVRQLLQEPTAKLGDMYQLGYDVKLGTSLKGGPEDNKVPDIRPELWRKYSPEWIGNTKETDHSINDWVASWFQQGLPYNVVANNCQKFVIDLAEFVSPGSNDRLPKPIKQTWPKWLAVGTIGAVVYYALDKFRI